MERGREVGRKSVEGRSVDGQQRGELLGVGGQLGAPRCSEAGKIPDRDMELRREEFETLEARLRSWTLREDNGESSTTVKPKVLPSNM